MLRAYRYEVAVARTGAAALDAAATWHPDRMVPDLGPPDLDAMDELLARNVGKVVGRRELLTELRGPNLDTQTHYLRVYLAQLRRKLEPDPSHPRHLLTEPGVGYRLVP